MMKEDSMEKKKINWRKISVAGIVALIATGALTQLDLSFIFHRNLLYNPGFEASKAGWSASSAATFALETGAGDIGLGLAAASFDASASSQTITSTAVAIQPGYFNTNGLATCRFRTSATDYKLQVWDGTDVKSETNIPAFSTYTKVGVNFVFPSTGSIYLRLVSASNAAKLYIDDCYLGSATNIQDVSQASLVGFAKIAATASCNDWVTSSATAAAFSTDAQCPGPTVLLNRGPGTIQTTDTDLPQFTVNSLPPGDYVVTMSVKAYAASGAVNSALYINDGTTTSPGVAFLNNYAAAATIPSTTITAAFSYTTTANRTFSLYGSVASSSMSIPNSGTGEDLVFMISRFPTSNSTVVTPAEAAAFRIDAKITGGNPGLTTGTVASYSDLTNASMTLMPQTSPASYPVGIACSAPATEVQEVGDTTCTGSEGSESVGITFNLLEAGVYTVCADYWYSVSLTANGNDVNFRIAETATNSLTALQYGMTDKTFGTRDDLVGAGYDTGTTSNHEMSFRHCDDFYFASIGTKVLRLFYTQTAGGFLTGSTVVATGQDASIHWSVKPAVKQQTLIVVPNLSGDQSYELRNVGIAASVSSNALTVALKQKDGATDCSPSNPCYMGFRSATAASGAYSQAGFIAASSITLAAADSIGAISAFAFPLTAYAIMDTTSEICLSRSWFDESQLQNASALTGGADVGLNTLWCPSAHTARPIRRIGQVKSAWSNPNWAAPTVLTLLPLESGCSHRNGFVDQCTESVTHTDCSSSPCTISSQSGAWVTSVTRSGLGQYVLNMPAGTWSAAMRCTCSTEQNDGYCKVTTSGSAPTTYQYYGLENGSTYQDHAVTLVCQGSR